MQNKSLIVIYSGVKQYLSIKINTNESKNNSRLLCGSLINLHFV